MSAPTLRKAARALLTAMEEWGGTLSFDAGVALCRLRYQLAAQPPGLEEIRRRLVGFWIEAFRDGMRVPDDDGEDAWCNEHSDVIDERDRLITELLAMFEPRPPVCRRGVTGEGGSPPGCDWPTCDCDPHASNVVDVLMEQGWAAPRVCAAPTECDWPFCACDPVATKVMAALEEQGFTLWKGPQHTDRTKPCPTCGFYISGSFVLDEDDLK